MRYSIAALFLIFAFAANGQIYDSLNLQKLNEIVVQENRLRIPLESSNRSIDIISKDDLKDAPYQSLAGMLQTVPGVDSRQRGIMGMQSDLSIRGSSFDENLVLLNGVKLTDPQTGHHLMNLPISYSDIEKVEVVKGAAARIYGQNAYAGAINIITRNPREKTLWAETFGGLGISDSKNSDSTFYSFGISAGASLPGEKYSQYLSLSRITSNGFQYNSDFTNNNAFYSGVLSLKNTDISVQGGYSMREFGANGFYAGNEEREKINTGLASIEVEKNLDNLRLVARAYTRVNKDDYKFNRFNPEWFHNVHRTNSSGVELNASLFSAAGITGLGWEFREEKITGLEEEQLANNPLLNDDFRNNMGFYLEHYYYKENFSVTPGVYFNIHSDYGFSAYPGVDLGYDINSNIKLLGSFGKSYRIPTFFDLYYSSAAAATYGDPDLQPGEAVTYEVGMQYKGKKLINKVNVFFIDAENSIDWVHDAQNPNVTWQARNFDNIIKYGTELSTEIVLPKESFFKELQIFYTYIFSNLQNNQYRSRYALSHLRHKAGVNSVMHITRNLYLSSNLFFFSRPSFRDENLLMGNQPTSNYFIADARLFIKTGISDIYLEGNNIFNARYVEAGSTERPGFWLRLGAKISVFQD